MGPGKAGRAIMRARMGEMIDYLRGFGVLVGFYLLGLLLHRIGIPIPGGVLGLPTLPSGLDADLCRRSASGIVIPCVRLI